MSGNTKLQRLVLSSICVAIYLLVIDGCTIGPHTGPFSQGTGLLNSGEYNSAIPYLKEALLIKPDYADAHYNLGLAYQRLGRQQEAIISYKETIRLNPNYSKAHNNLGKAYEALGRNDESSAEYKETLRLDPSDTIARNNLNLLDPSNTINRNTLNLLGPFDQGTKLLKEGEYDSAIPYLKEAIRINPDYARHTITLGGPTTDERQLEVPFSDN